MAEKKHPEFESTIYLKALLTKEDINDLPIIYKKGFEVNRNNVLKTIESETLKYISAYKNN